MTLLRWVLNGFKIIDVILNWFPFFGSHVETLSRRAGRARDDGKRWGCVFCHVVDWLALKLCRQADHCTKAVKSGEIR